MILNWLLRGTFLDVWRRFFHFNLAMISVSLILYYFEEERGHLFMAVVWSILALMGLFIRKVIDDHPYSE